MRKQPEQIRLANGDIVPVVELAVTGTELRVMVIGYDNTEKDLKLSSEKFELEYKGRLSEQSKDFTFKLALCLIQEGWNRHQWPNPHIYFLKPKAERLKIII